MNAGVLGFFGQFSPIKKVLKLRVYSIHHMGILNNDGHSRKVGESIVGAKMTKM
jgi:hypothetical protein